MKIKQIESFWKDDQVERIKMVQRVELFCKFNSSVIDDLEKERSLGDSSLTSEDGMRRRQPLTKAQHHSVLGLGKKFKGPVTIISALMLKSLLYLYQVVIQ